MQFSDDKIKEKLELLRRKEEEESIKLLSTKYKLPYLDLTTLPMDLEALKLIPEEQARAAGLAAIRMVGKNLKIAIRNPEKEETKAILKKLEENNFNLELFFVSGHSMELALGYYQKIPKEIISETGLSVREEKLEELSTQIKNTSDLKSMVEKTFGGRTTEVLEIIIAGALAIGASDVHVEPQETESRLRYRLDGVLRDILNIPVKIYTHLLSRLKLLSELKLNVRDKPQDGRFTIKTRDAKIEVRTSTMPGPYGENVVMRILDPKALGVKFEDLGMQPEIIQLMERELKKPNGMILTTGPTGSGKTTTLYSFLKKIHTPEIKIITLEDPIEYHLTGVEQTQIDASRGYTFAAGLRAVLRQDPDVILVGEVRDKETAETALHAALTGHLVFSTLHTNNAAGTIPRLIDLEVKPSVIAPALNAVIAQRLVRKLCKKCGIKTELNQADLEKIEKELGDFPKSFKVPVAKSWTIFQSAKEGCDQCVQGYKGRAGVYEIILIDDLMEKLILQQPSEFEIKKAALEQGQITMRQDGLLKILAGTTDFEELERVVGT